MKNSEYHENTGWNSSKKLLKINILVQLSKTLAFFNAFIEIFKDFCFLYEIIQFVNDYFIKQKIQSPRPIESMEFVCTPS